MARRLLVVSTWPVCFALGLGCGGSTADPQDERPRFAVAAHERATAVAPPAAAAYERHALRGDELCNPNLYEMGDDDPPLMLCWQRASVPDGARPAASLEDVETALFVEPQSPGSPVTLVGEPGACVTTTNARAFVYTTDGAFEGFTLNLEPCGTLVGATVVLAGAHADATIQSIIDPQRLSRGARALALLRRSGLSLAPSAHRPDSAGAASIEGTDVRVVTASWVTPAAPDEGLDDDYTKGFVSVWRGERSAVVGVAWGDHVRMLRVGDRTFLVFTGPGGLVHGAMTFFFELMADELTLRLTECEGVPADFDDPSCGIPDASAVPEYAHLAFARGTAEREISGYASDE